MSSIDPYAGFIFPTMLISIWLIVRGMSNSQQRGRLPPRRRRHIRPSPRHRHAHPHGHLHGHPPRPRPQDEEMEVEPGWDEGGGAQEPRRRGGAGWPGRPKAPNAPADRRGPGDLQERDPAKTPPPPSEEW